MASPNYQPRMNFFSKFFVRRRSPKFEADVSTNAKKVGILADLNSASVCYLIAPEIAAQGKTLQSICLDASDELRVDLFCYKEIIISRYIAEGWIKKLKFFRSAGGRVIYFMDDDLMDHAALVNLAPPYRKKIVKFATRYRKDIEEICDEFWVATPYLANKYECWKPKLLAPLPSSATLRSPSVKRICYHGTASHQGELRWLVPVVAAVLEQEVSAHFELFGDLKTNRLYRTLPRVSILHPMSWKNYLAYTSSIKTNIGLAPLLDDPFNAARGPTKFFDFARMGAVGIYTDTSPYREFVRHGVDGILLPNDPKVWVMEITRLLSDPVRMGEMAAAARLRAFDLAWDKEVATPEAAEKLDHTLESS